MRRWQEGRREREYECVRGVGWTVQQSPPLQDSPFWRESHSGEALLRWGWRRARSSPRVARGCLPAARERAAAPSPPPSLPPALPQTIVPFPGGADGNFAFPPPPRAPCARAVRVGPRYLYSLALPSRSAASLTGELTLLAARAGLASGAGAGTMGALLCVGRSGSEGGREGKRRFPTVAHPHPKSVPESLRCCERRPGAGAPWR